jgi:hypothetical protein
LKKIKTIIIGLGNIGLNYDYNLSDSFILTHARAIDRNSSFKILCGIDKDKKQLLKFSNKYQCPGFKSLSKFNQLNKTIIVDFVIISVKENSHLITIKQVFKYYKPKVILCEKPLGANGIDAESIVNLCEKNQTKLFINYTRNTDYNFKYLVKFLKKKTDGVVRYRKSFIKNASHFLALFRVVLGKVTLIKKNKLSNYSVHFKNGILIFKSEKKKEMQNTYELENKDYKFVLNNKYFLIFNKKTKKIKVKNKIDTKNNQQVIWHIENYFKKKRNNLVNSNIALELWNTMKKIK